MRERAFLEGHAPLLQHFGVPRKLSGFAAIVRFDGQPVDPAALERMTGAMAYRAEDGIRHLHTAPMGMGHCAFRTTPEAAEAVQPLRDADGRLAIVMDGWLANPDELRAELLAKGAPPRWPSDAELVLQAYRVWGEDCVDRIEGEYACVIHDAALARVFCAKDHAGMRPLFHHWDGRRLLVASDVAAVLAAQDFAQRLNEDRMAQYLASDFQTLDETVWAGVMRLPLASCMTVDASGPKVRQYWSLSSGERIRYRRDEDYFAHYREVLMDCVRRASRSQLPIACEVSGGHDSSAIFALARRLKEAGQLQAPDALGFTYRGIPGTISDEIAYARDVGRFLGVPIHEAEPTLPDISWFINQISRDRDIPLFPNGQSASAQMALIRTHGCRVVLDGEGGDEFVGASDHFIHAALRDGQWGLLARELRIKARKHGARHAAQRLFRFGLRQFLPAPLNTLVRAWRGYQPASQHGTLEGRDWLAPAVHDRLASRQETLWREDTIWRMRDPWRRRLWRELNDPFFEVMRDNGARLSAHLGVELRSPMYTRRFIAFIAAMPPTLTIREGEGKYIHLKALEHDLPRSVLDRRDKCDFGFTFEHQLQRLAPLFQQTIPDAAPAEIDAEGLARLYLKFLNDGSYKWELWNLFGWFHLRQQA